MTEITINRSKPVQENFLGNNAVYHGYAGLPDNAGRVYSDELCEIEADRAKELGVKIARTYFKWYAWDRKTGWNWDNETMTAFYKWCDRMKKRDIDIAIHGGWCCPGDINNSSWGGDGPFADGDLDYDSASDNFAEYVSEMIHQLVEVRGFTNVKYIMLFTESERYSGKGDGRTPFEMWELVSRKINDRLLKDGRRNLVKLIGPNENARGNGYPKALEYAAGHASDFLDGYGCHIYARQCIEDENCCHSGKRTVPMCKPGHRIQQKVALKKGKTYTFSAWLNVVCDEPRTISGSIIMGAYNVPDENNITKLFPSGGQPTDRLTKESSIVFDPIILTDGWKQISVTFTAENSGNAVVGVFSDIKTKATLYADDFSLTEDKSEKNILKNPSVEEETKDWIGAYSTPVAYDIYNDVKIWTESMNSYIPTKTLWYDEYNCMQDYTERFTDPIHGTRVAMMMVAMMNAGAQTSLIWTIFDQQWPNNHTNNHDSFIDGVHKCGLMPVLSESLIPYPDYYAFGLVARYAGNSGAKIYAETDGAVRLHATLSELPDGNVSVIVVNSRKNDEEVIVNLSKTSDKPFNRHVFDPATVKPDEKAKLAGTDKIFPVGEDKIKDVIPAGAVVVYTTLNN